MSANTPPESLRKLPLFSPLTDTQFTWMLPAIQHRIYRPRMCILRAGETPDGLYTILTGRARVTHEDGEGHALIVTDYGPHQFFGEMGLIDSTPCPVSVHALDECEVAYVPRKQFLECIEDSGAAALYMLRSTLERLCFAHSKIGELALLTVSERVARVMLDNSRNADGIWMVQPGSEQIAGMVGASREMVSRVIKQMIGKGVVRRYKRRLIVLDRAALADTASRNTPRRIANAEAQRAAPAARPG